MSDREHVDPVPDEAPDEALEVAEARDLDGTVHRYPLPRVDDGDALQSPSRDDEGRPW